MSKMVIATSKKEFSSTIFGNVSVDDKLTMGEERHTQMWKAGYVEKKCTTISPNKPGPKPKAK